MEVYLLSVGESQKFGEPYGLANNVLIISAHDGMYTGHEINFALWQAKRRYRAFCRGNNRRVAAIDRKIIEYCTWKSQLN